MKIVGPMIIFVGLSLGVGGVAWVSFTIKKHKKMLARRASRRTVGNRRSNRDHNSGGGGVGSGSAGGNERGGGGGASNELTRNSSQKSEKNHGSGGGGGKEGEVGEGGDDAQNHHHHHHSSSRKGKLLPSPLEAVALAVSKLEDPEFRANGGHQPPVSPRPYISRTTSPRNVSPKTPKTISTGVSSSAPGGGGSGGSGGGNGNNCPSGRSSGRSTAQISPKDMATIPEVVSKDGRPHLHTRQASLHSSKDTLDDVDAVPLLNYDDEPKYSPRTCGTVFEYPPLLENTENNI